MLHTALSAQGGRLAPVSSMWLTDRIFLQTHVTFRNYLAFHEFRLNLYITIAEYLEQEGITDLLFFKFFIHSFLKD